MTTYLLCLCRDSWKDAMIYFGVDPGSVYTGFGIIKAASPGVFVHMDSGRICCGKRPFSERLALIYKHLSSLISEYNPDCIVVEQLFVHKNAMSALKLGHARGVALLVAAQSTAQVVEYTPRQVKLALTGYGAAQKDQVAFMVQKMLALNASPSSDAADALALAITHANASKLLLLSS